MLTGPAGVHRKFPDPPSIAQGLARDIPKVGSSRADGVLLHSQEVLAII